MTMTPEQFCKIINDAFGEDFMPKGFVEATKRGAFVNLRIGARDVSFAMDGKWLGQGTHLKSKWFQLLGVG